MKISNLLTAEGLTHITDQPAYTGWVLNLSKMFGAKKLGFHLEIMDPKTFSAPYHFHTEEEECFYIIEGEAVIRRDGEFRKVGAGDFIFYEVGPKSVHAMYNFTEKPLKFLALSINDPVGDKCFYPDSGKETSERGILQNGEVVNYFKDEEDPARYWPEWALRGDVPSVAKSSP